MHEKMRVGSVAAAAMSQLSMLGGLALAGWVPPANIAWLGALAFAGFAAFTVAGRSAPRPTSTAGFPHETARSQGNRR